MRKENIIIISPSFYPDKIGIANYNYLTAKFFSNNKHRVHVVTAMPYYPEWKIKKPYDKAPFYLKETIGKGIIVYRTKMYVPTKPTTVKRIFQVLHFLFFSLKHIPSLPIKSKVLVVAPYTINILLGLLLKWFKKCKIWCHVQDFEFDLGIQNFKLGFLSQSLYFLEKTLLKKCDKVSTISQSMKKKLYLKTSIKGYYFPNFVDLDSYKKSFTPHSYYLNSTKPNLLYSGNIGEKQDWAFFIRFCHFNIEKLNFTIVGDGPKLDWIKKQLNKQKNVRFYRLVKSSDLPRLLRSFDAHLLFQKNNILDSVMPSKLLGMMASKKPCFVKGNKESEIKKIIRVSESGIFFDDNNIEKITESIIEYLANKKAIEKKKIVTENFLKENFSQKKVLLDFKKSINNI